MAKELKRRITVQSAKAKGRRLQQWVCRKISELTGIPWGPDCPIESRPMGQNGCDVRLESQVIAEFPFSVECKAQENWAIPGWIKQAMTNQMANTDWLLVCKRRNESPVVIISAETFFKLLRRAK